MGWKVLALAGAAGFLAIGAASGTRPWDARDVAAAEEYRETERARAGRYRAQAANAAASSAPVRAARTDQPTPEAARSKPAPRRQTADARWLERALAPVLDEFDTEAISEMVDEVQGWVSWWNQEAAPRLRNLERWAREEHAHAH